MFCVGLSGVSDLEGGVLVGVMPSGRKGRCPWGDFVAYRSGEGLSWDC